MNNLNLLSKIKKYTSTVYFDYLYMVFLGILVAFGLPPFSYYIFTMMGLLLIFHKINKISSNRYVVFYMIFMFLGYFLFSSYWLMNPFLSSDKFVAKLMLPIGILGFLFASTIYSLPFFFLPFFKKTISKVVAFSAFFAISEWIRSFVFVGFGYNMLGTMWYNNQTIAQSVSIFGVYGLTFVTVLFFIYPYLLVFDRKKWKKLILPSAFLISFFALLITWGRWRLYFAEEKFFNDNKVRIVQPSINTVYDYIPSIIYRNTYNIKYLVNSKNINDIKAVFLHETAFRSYVSNQQKDVMQNVIGDVIPSNGYLISGMPRIEYSWNSSHTSFDKLAFNSIIAIDSEFNIKGKYFKKRLVPFGEYIPYVFKMFLPKVLTVGSGFNFPNEEDETLIKLNDLPQLSFSLCNEDGHAGQLIKYDLKKDVGAIVNAANISWFGDNSAAPIQNYAYAVMRAIEEGVPNIRVVNKGISGIISPYGSMVEGDVVIVDKNDYQTVIFSGKRDRIIPSEAGIIDVKIPVKVNRTFYNMFGNYFVISFLFLILLSVFILDRRKMNNKEKLSNDCLLNFDLSKLQKIFKNKNFWLFLIAFLLGCFFVFSAPPFKLFFPAVVSIVGLYVLFDHYKDSLLHTLILLFLFFYSYFFWGSSWVTGPMRLAGVENAFNRYADIFHITIPFFIFLASSISFLFIRKIKNNTLRFLGFSFAFTLGEWFRSQAYLLTGFPFLYLGSIWIPIKPVLQFASLFGVYGLTFITVFCFSSIAVIFLKYRNRFLYVFCSVLLLSSIFLWGKFRIKDNIYHENLTMRLVQPLKNRRLDITDLKEFESNLKLLLDVSVYYKNKNVNLLIFPEASIPFNIALDSIDSVNYRSYFDQIKNVIPKNGYLIAGFIGKYIIGNIFDTKNTDIKSYNMVGLFDSKFNMLGSYKKVHLVPLGEYVPNYLSTLFHRKITAGAHDLVPGLNRNIFYNSDHSVIPPFVANLCYEEVYSSHITDKNIIKNNKVDWLLNLTDDVWFRETDYPEHHFEASVLRAVEEGLSYVRVANDGPSAVIDKYGRLVIGDASVMTVENNKIKLMNKIRSGILKYFQVGVLDVRLPVSDSYRTLYSITGDYLIRNFLMIGLLFIIAVDFILQKKYKLIVIFYNKLKDGFYYMYFDLIDRLKH